jgi:hypothetical protein
MATNLARIRTSSVFRQSARSCDNQRLHALSCTVDSFNGSSHVPNENRALLQVTRTHRKLNAWWWLVSMELGRLVAYSLYILCICSDLLHDLAIHFRDFHISKRLVAPSCILSSIYFFSCSITAGALIVRSLKNSRPSPPCLSILALSRECDHSRVLT